MGRRPVGKIERRQMLRMRRRLQTTPPVEKAADTPVKPKRKPRVKKTTPMGKQKTTAKGGK